MGVWDDSSFLDLTGYGLTTASTPEAAYGVTRTTALPSDDALVVALVLPRSSDVTPLLSEEWAQREAALDGKSVAQIGALYGADMAQFGSLESFLAGVSGAQILSGDGYTSSPSSRTVWVSLNASAFQTLFGQALQRGAIEGSTPVTFWDGTLTPTAGLGNLSGMWVETSAYPATSAQSTNGVTLLEGPQGVGNTSGGGYQNSGTSTHADLYPNQVAAEYDFPLDLTGASTVTTPTVGLLEPLVGDAVDAGSDPNQLLQMYRAGAQVSGSGTISAGPGGVAGSEDAGDSGERSLDVGVIAAATPNSNIVTYSGNADGDTYADLEQAIWGGTIDAGDVSSSDRISPRVAPGSPFFAALQGLYQDAALNNISLFQSSGDGGSSALLDTGVPEVNETDVSPYSVSVGGTSISSQDQVAAAAAADTGGAANINAAIGTLATAAIGGDVAALETLVAGGLTQDPTSTSNIADLLQSTWNNYDYNAASFVLSSGYFDNHTGGGGVDAALSEPAYQIDDGIDTAALQAASGVTAGATGKGDPDVSALAGGNADYAVPTEDLTGVHGDGGTSGAAPLWAALTAQIQAVFADQGLPSTGYFNDLLYQAAAIDPGAFDDVQFGNNTSTYIYNANGTVTTDDTPITPTGTGYTAGPGYDLTTGLGTPDGILLTRALTQIAQTQEYSGNTTPITDATGTIAAADEALIVEPTLAATFSGSLTVGDAGFAPSSDGSGTGWSARIAQQALQSYFQANLADAIAGVAQAASTQIEVTEGQSVAVSIAGTLATPTAQADTSGYGFVTDVAGANSVTLARPLAIADTYGGQNDTDAILRLRQESSDQDSLTFYRVDDLDGTINNIAPGSAGYAAAAEGRAYVDVAGRKAIAGPGAGNFLQTDLTGVNAGDIIAFRLIDHTTGQTFWGLASQNGGTNALWSYGADTWGMNDSTSNSAFDAMVFQLDFTSNAGSGLVADDTAATVTGESVSRLALQSTAQSNGEFVALSGSTQAISAGADTIQAGSGAETVLGSGNAADMVFASSGALIFAGAGGAGTVLGAGGAATLLGGSGGGVFFGGNGGNLMAGGTGGVTMVGGTGGDLLYGGTGTNLLVASAGNTTLLGGAGSSVLFASSGSSTLEGGAGATTIVGSASGAQLMIGGSTQTTMFGGGADTLFGGSGGGTVMVAGAPSETMVGGAGASTMLGGSNGDAFIGGSGMADVVGGSGNDMFAAGSGMFTVYEGNGNDLLLGGSGAATVMGGAGFDTYGFASGAGGGTLVVSGFKSGEDQIALYGYGNAPVQQSVDSSGLSLTLSDGSRMTLLGITTLQPDAIKQM